MVRREGANLDDDVVNGKNWKTTENMGIGEYVRYEEGKGKRKN